MMLPVIVGLMGWLLLRSAVAMDAASAACHLFVSSVLPGLFPYMTLSLMLCSRLHRPVRPAMLLLAGWGGGSPTGARLLRQCPGVSGAARLAVRSATMSPMFLIGTVGAWLHSTPAGVVVLLSVLLGGYLAGYLAGDDRPAAAEAMMPAVPMSFGSAVETSAKTMLLVCGTMTLLRVFAELMGEALSTVPDISLSLTTLLEVTRGTEMIAQMSLPLPLRTAMIAGATGFGGAAILVQNRALYPPGLLTPARQLGCQAAHGALSFLLALGMMQLIG